MSSATDTVLAAIKARGLKVRRSGKGWSCQCPAHDDKNPSLSVKIGEDGRALVRCHGGCRTEDIVAELGLAMKDLMPERSPASASKPKRTTASAKPESAAGASDFATADDAVAALGRTLGSAHRRWVYTDADGEPVGEVVRWDPEGKRKVVRPLARRGDRWMIGAMPEPRPPMHLPELAALPEGAWVFIVEGEACVDAARAIGFVATTSAGGAEAPHLTDWSVLKNRVAVILADNDEAGEKFAETVAERCRKAGADKVRMPRLVDAWPDLPAGGDIVDVLEMEGGDAKAVHEKLEALALATEPEPREERADNRYVPFPVEALPEPVRSYIAEGARAIGCDASFLALPMLAGLASAIGNTRRLAIKRSWSEPPILWCAIVGESGTAKSPAMELALRPIRSRQHRAMKEHAETMKAWQADYARWEVEHASWKKNAAKGDDSDPPPAPERPICPRVWFDDCTVEALVTRLKENPRGLLMVRDELAAWFGFDRYNGGKGGAEVPKWLEVFGGRALIVDRKTSGTEYVERASVSIIGGIQPATLQRAIAQEHRDNGLAARLLFAMPPRRPKQWTEDDVSERTEAAAARVFDHLYALEPDTDAEGDATPRLLPLTSAAKTVWIEFVNRHGVEQADRVGDEAAAWAKLEAFCARFALVLHMARVAAGDPTIADPDAVDEHSIAAGVRLVGWFAREADRFYELMRGDENDRDRRRLAEWINARHNGVASVRDLTHGLRAFKGNREKAKAALDDLVASGAGDWDHGGGRPGRPSPRVRLRGAAVPENPAQPPATRGFGGGDGP